MSKLENKISIMVIISLLLVSALMAGITFGPFETARAQSPPRELEGHSWNQTQVNLTWTAPTGGPPGAEVDHYNISRGVGDREPSYYNSTGNSTLEYIDENVTQGRTYSYYVTADYVNMGESGPTETVNVTVEGLSPPTVPQNLETLPDDRKVQLKWDAPTDNGGSEITRYNISRGTTTDSLASHDHVSAPKTSYLDSNLQNGQTYYYRVKAVNEGGESAPSNLASAEPTEKIVVPSYPQNLRAYSGDEKVELYWDAPDNIAEENIIEYKVYRGREKHGGGNLIGTPKGTSYIDEGVDNGDDYYYTVTAVNSKDEESLRSNEAKGEPSATGLPDRPTNLRSNGAEEKIEISWNRPANSDITGYVLLRGNSTENLSFLKEIEDGTQTEYEDKDIEKDTTYSYEVKALNDGMISDPSGVAEASLHKDEGGTDDSLPWTIIVLALLVLVALFGIALWKKEKERGPPRGEDHEWKHQEEEAEEAEGKGEEAGPSTPGDRLAGEQGSSTEEISEDGEIEITSDEDWG